MYVLKITSFRKWKNNKKKYIEPNLSTFILWARGSSHVIVSILWKKNHTRFFNVSSAVIFLETHRHIQLVDYHINTYYTKRGLNKSREREITSLSLNVSCCSDCISFVALPLAHVPYGWRHGSSSPVHKTSRDPRTCSHCGGAGACIVPEVQERIKMRKMQGKHCW